MSTFLAPTGALVVLMVYNSFLHLMRSFRIYLFAEHLKTLQNIFQDVL